MRTVELSSTTCIVYSPTRTTHRIVVAIAEGLGTRITTYVDLTRRRTDAVKVTVAAHDLAVFGVPVYAGRVALTAVDRLQCIRGQETPALLVVVYGNRAYEDALLELADLVSVSGFVPIAAAAFVGEHSYSTEANPIAVGRPDERDLGQAAAFGQAVRALLQCAGSVHALDRLTPPGNRPYRRGMRPWGASPATLADLCTLCGLCADVCPVGAITVGQSVETDGWACTLCSACIKVCPTGARVMADEDVLRTARWLATEHSTRKEPELYLARLSCLDDAK